MGEIAQLQGRIVSATEHGWCHAVRGGTGIAVLAILTSKSPEIPHFENALKKLQNSHPTLKCKLHSHTKSSRSTFSLLTSPPNFIKVKHFDLSSTFKILENISGSENQNLSPLHVLLEHELNLNPWVKNSDNGIYDMFFATTYALPNSKWVVVLRLHGVGCDRTTAISLLRELQVVLVQEGEGGSGGGGRVEMQIENKGKICLGMEDLIPDGKVKKTIWTRGVDMLGYSVNSLGLTNLKFKDAKSPRSSQVVRLQLNQDDTQKIIAGCKSKGIRLCGALGAAGLIAAQRSRSRIDKHRKYGIVTLIDCRSLLQPPLSPHQYGFYHSTILNTHVVKGKEKLWELAEKVYTEFTNYKNDNRHFTDMADLSFLMCKAIDNPSLTPSSSLRTSILSIFEDTVIHNSDDKGKDVVGLEDYMGCASVHGIGPSIGIFDTIRDGRLDCLCVYPSPLHSRDQMEEFVEKMKSVLVDGANHI
ncbi:hypothetical protein JCGZ_06774 [Jatropha curcas]|uniref:Phthiocerol/phthiodiolone dimycocerosyl transferase C-terminal domain-containing protein n=1 Tax=Jatropha curcas TaxID=180498 RepID=A0A067KYI4_JATCU|nr:uncharacterized protein LOC105634706 [Jatropha curcas]KDP37320.1 hypothetical protein JCGZ_06774 [Jatropha curcas]